MEEYEHKQAMMQQQIDDLQGAVDSVNSKMDQILELLAAESRKEEERHRAIMNTAVNQGSSSKQPVKVLKSPMYGMPHNANPQSYVHTSGQPQPQQGQNPMITDGHAAQGAFAGQTDNVELQQESKCSISQKTLLSTKMQLRNPKLFGCIAT